MPKRPDGRPEKPKNRGMDADSGEYLSDEDPSFVTGDFFSDILPSADGGEGSEVSERSSGSRPKLRVVEGGQGKRKEETQPEPRGESKPPSKGKRGAAGGKEGRGKDGRIPSSIHVNQDLLAKQQQEEPMTEPGILPDEEDIVPERPPAEKTRFDAKPSPFDAFPPVGPEVESGAILIETKDVVPLDASDSKLPPVPRPGLDGRQGSDEPLHIRPPVPDLSPDEDEPHTAFDVPAEDELVTESQGDAGRAEPMDPFAAEDSWPDADELAGTHAESEPTRAGPPPTVARARGRELPEAPRALECGAPRKNANAPPPAKGRAPADAPREPPMAPDVPTEEAPVIRREPPDESSWPSQPPVLERVDAQPRTEMEVAPEPDLGPPGGDEEDAEIMRPRNVAPREPSGLGPAPRKKSGKLRRPVPEPTRATGSSPTPMDRPGPEVKISKGRRTGPQLPTMEKTPAPSDIPRDDLLEPPGDRGDGATRIGKQEVIAPPSDATRPKAKSAALQRPVGRLVVEEGPHAGQVFSIVPGTHVMGRGKDAALMLPDDAVSRRHCEFVCDGERVLLRDLGSGNGTRVNKKKVDETALVHGDRVQLGHHVLRFEETGAAGAAVRRQVEAEESKALQGGLLAKLAGPADQRGKRYVILGVAAVVLFVIIGVAVHSISVSRERARQEQEQRAQAAAQLRQRIADLVAEGNVRLGRGEPREALEAFREAASLDTDGGNPAIKRGMEDANRRSELERRFSQWRKFAAQGDFAGAKKILDEMNPSGDDADEVRKQYEDLRQQRMSWYRKKAEEAEAGLLVEEARAAWGKVLEDAPGDTFANEAVQRLPDLAKRAEAKQKDQEKADRANKGKKVKQREKADSAAVRQGLASAIEAFNAGKFSQAIDLADRASRSPNPQVHAKAGRVRAKVAEFEARFPTAWEHLQDAIHAQSGSESLCRETEAVAAIAREVDAEGAQARKAGEAAAKAHYITGRSAQMSNDFRAARKHYKRAIQFDGSSKAAENSAAGLRLIEEHVADLYRDAYSEPDPGERTRRMREILDLTDPGSKFHNKAKAVLEGEAGGNSGD